MTEPGPTYSQLAANGCISEFKLTATGVGRILVPSENGLDFLCKGSVTSLSCQGHSPQPGSCRAASSPLRDSGGNGGDRRHQPTGGFRETDRHPPFGLGEPGVITVAPENAIFYAVGARMRDLGMRPEAVLKAMGA
jgi:hypothetical protein